MTLKLETNNCSTCSSQIMYLIKPNLIQKVLCPSCNNYSHFIHILNTK